MRRAVLMTGLALTLVPTAVQAMTVSEFLAKADALKAKGVLALASPDVGLLRQEIMSASAAYRAGLDAQIAAGRKPSSCPPPKGTAKVTSDDILKEFRSLPPAGQKANVKDAFAAFMTKRYPCKA